MCGFGRKTSGFFMTFPAKYQGTGSAKKLKSSARAPDGKETSSRDSSPVAAIARFGILMLLIMIVEYWYNMV